MQHRNPEAAEALNRALRELWTCGRITPSPPREEARTLASVINTRLHRRQPDPTPTEPATERRADRSQGAVGAAMSPAVEFSNFLDSLTFNRVVGHL